MKRDIKILFYSVLIVVFAIGCLGGGSSGEDEEVNKPSANNNVNNNNENNNNQNNNNENNNTNNEEEIKLTKLTNAVKTLYDSNLNQDKTNLINSYNDIKDYTDSDSDIVAASLLKKIGDISKTENKLSASVKLTKKGIRNYVLGIRAAVSDVDYYQEAVDRLAKYIPQLRDPNAYTDTVQRVCGVYLDCKSEQIKNNPSDIANFETVSKIAKKKVTQNIVTIPPTVYEKLDDGSFVKKTVEKVTKFTTTKVDSLRVTAYKNTANTVKAKEIAEKILNETRDNNSEDLKFIRAQVVKEKVDCHVIDGEYDKAIELVKNSKDDIKQLEGEQNEVKDLVTNLAVAVKAKKSIENFESDTTSTTITTESIQMELEESLSGIFGNTEFDQTVKTMMTQTTTTVVNVVKVHTDEVYYSQISTILVPDMSTFKVSDEKIASAKELISKMKLINFKYKSYIKLIAVYVLNKNLNLALVDVNRYIDDLTFVESIMNGIVDKTTEEYRNYEEAYSMIYSFYDLKQTILLLKAGFTREEIDTILESDNYLPVITKFDISGKKFYKSNGFSSITFDYEYEDLNSTDTVSDILEIYIKVYNKDRSFIKKYDITDFSLISLTIDAADFASVNGGFSADLVVKDKQNIISVKTQNFAIFANEADDIDLVLGETVSEQDKQNFEVARRLMVTNIYEDDLNSKLIIELENLPELMDGYTILAKLALDDSAEVTAEVNIEEQIIELNGFIPVKLTETQKERIYRVELIYSSATLTEKFRVESFNKIFFSVIDAKNEILSDIENMINYIDPDSTVAELILDHFENPIVVQERALEIRQLLNDVKAYFSFDKSALKSSLINSFEYENGYFSFEYNGFVLEGLKEGNQFIFSYFDFDDTLVMFKKDSKIFEELIMSYFTTSNGKYIFDSLKETELAAKIKDSTFNPLEPHIYTNFITDELMKIDMPTNEFKINFDDNGIVSSLNLNANTQYGVEFDDYDKKFYIIFNESDISNLDYERVGETAFMYIDKVEQRLNALDFESDEYQYIKNLYEQLSNMIEGNTYEVVNGSGEVVIIENN